MEHSPLSLTHLESLATTDLLALAESFGIDIPEGLNRRFVIGELLEIAEDIRLHSVETAILVDTDFATVSNPLPETYNETCITALMRDPGWIFVFWDFHNALYTALTTNRRFESFFLRVNSLSTDKDAAPVDYYDIDVGLQDRKWYVHLPVRTQGCRIDLCIRNSQEKEQVLTKSAELFIPCAGMIDSMHDPKRRNPPLLDLSGINELRKEHFRNHRQSFV